MGVTKKVVIVGTGVTGTAVLIELTRLLKRLLAAGRPMPAVEITTIEKSPLNGPGYPYDPMGCHPQHLLNHPAIEMAIRPIDQDGNELDTSFEFAGWHSYDFVRWLDEEKDWLLANYPEVAEATYPGLPADQWRADPKQFYPRMIYGLYMQERFKEVVEELKGLGVTVKTYCNTEVIDGQRVGERLSLTLSNVQTGEETTVLADRLLLATGGWKRETSVRRRVACQFDSPFPTMPIIEAIRPSVPKNGRAKRILIWGMGLSALDAVLSLGTGRFYRNKAGKLCYRPGKDHAQIIVASRGGYFPVVRGKPDPMPRLKVVTQQALDRIKAKHGGYLTLSALKELLEKELKLHLGEDFDLVAYVRPDMSAEDKLRRDLEVARRGNVVSCLFQQAGGFKLFSQLAPEDREYFFRHLFSDFLRNISAMPVVNAEKLLALFEAGVLQSVRLGYGEATVEAKDDGVRLDYSDEHGLRKTLDADYVIRATGSEVDIEQNPSPLFQSLLRQEEIVANRTHYYDIDKALAMNYTEEQRQLAAAGQLELDLVNTGGIKIYWDDYSVVRIGADGQEERSRMIAAIGAPVTNWVVEEAFASASIKAARILASKWLDDLQLQDGHGETMRRASLG